MKSKWIIVSLVLLFLIYGLGFLLALLINPISFNFNITIVLGLMQSFILVNTLLLIIIIYKINKK